VPDGATSKLTVSWMGEDKEEAKISVDQKYRLGEFCSSVLSNSNNEIDFIPRIVGQWEKAERIDVTDYIYLTAYSAFGIDNIFVTGSPMVIITSETDDARTSDGDINDTFIIEDFKINKIIKIYFPIVDGVDNVASFEDQYFRMLDIRDMISADDYLYIPLGQKISVIPSSNLVRNASKVRVKGLDAFGNSFVVEDGPYVSLKGVTDIAGEYIEGCVIEFTLSDLTFSKKSYGDEVFDCNETEEIIGVYESCGFIAPVGFAYWTEFRWEEVKPPGTEVEFYIKTAENEMGINGLDTAIYNADAFDIVHASYTSADFDIPSESPDSIDISRYSSDGTKNERGEIKRRKWMQWKLIIKSSSNSVSPTVSMVRISYNSVEERVVLLKNMTLTSNISKGFLVANTELPDGTSITFGITTSDETNFNLYQIIPTNESFDILDKNAQFKLAAKLISAGEVVPKIYSFAFMFNTEDQDSEELLNINL
jgi:hypothetical protein